MMIASLVFFYAPGGGSDADLVSNSSETAAKVGNDVVSLGEVSKIKKMYESFGRGQSQSAKKILDDLIKGKVAVQEAKRMGFDTSDDELRSKIRQDFTPQDGKPFEQKRYEQIAVDRSGSIAKFEQSMRDDISSQKLQAFVSSSVNVSEAEVLDEFKKRNTKLDLKYVAVNSEEISKTLKPNDEELKAYFEKNKQTYYISLPQKRFVIFLSTKEKLVKN
jgi:hypothetical protein